MNESSNMKKLQMEVGEISPPQEKKEENRIEQNFYQERK